VSKFRDYLQDERNKKIGEITSAINGLKNSNIILKTKFDDETRIELIRKFEVEINNKLDNFPEEFHKEYLEAFKSWYSFLKAAENYYKPSIREDKVSFEEYSKEMSKFFDAINIGVISDRKGATEEEKNQSRQNEKNERLRFSELINLKLKNNPNEGIKLFRNLEYSVKDISTEFEKRIEDKREDLVSLINVIMSEKSKQSDNIGVAENGLVKKSNMKGLEGIKGALTYLKNIREMEAYANNRGNANEEIRKSS
jgi:hypothetical protein